MSARSTPRPPCFPRSSRRLGSGTLGVAEVAARLRRLYDCHRSLMRVLAGWIIAVAELEPKLELAHHVHAHAEAAARLRQRLIELRVSEATLEGPVDEVVRRWEGELLWAADTAELVAGTHGVMATALLAAQDELAAATDGLADQPTLRALAVVRLELAPLCEWGERCVEAFVDAGYDAGRLEAWRGHLRRLVSASGGLLGAGEAGDAPPLRSAAGGFRRAIECGRDERFCVFHHTRDYARAHVSGATLASEYEQDRLAMIRTQRDELDAIETFANVLFDKTDASFEAQRLLARLVWDEARHAEIGQQALAALGHDPFAVPCGIIGIKVRSPLSPELAFAQISIFGELGVVGELRRLHHDALRHGDVATARMLDFIHADELTHLRRGRALLETWAHGDLATLERRAREAAVQRLHEEGVVGEDYLSSLGPREIGRLLGE